MARRMVLPGLALLAAGAGPALAQTTQGLISGRVRNAVTGLPVGGASVTWTNYNTNATGQASSSESGYYALPLLDPGTYRVRVSAARYQAQEVHQLELPVGARLDLRFRLRPLSDVWEAGQYRSVFLPGNEAILTFYGPDVDTSRTGSFVAARGEPGALEATLSQVIDPVQVRELPLAGRDVYTMLVTQPGVTADSGTARGLGLSVNGQRPSASNFLLDGIENNNYQVTGPLTAVAPEAVQQYRITTNNFSAEYGRTSGFLANAVTRSGGSAWHGIGYYNFKNDWLNANTFQRNRLGLSRAPLKENQVGYHAGGPLPGSRSLFLSSSYDLFHSRSVDAPTEVVLPTTIFAAQFTAPNSTARELLTRFPAPAVTDRNLPTASVTVTAPVTVTRHLGLQRLDWRPRDGRQQLIARFGWNRLERPDFIWSPYEDFVSGLSQNTYSFAAGWQATVGPRLASESRVGWVSDELGWDRAHPEIPTLLDSLEGTVLPGSYAYYAFRNPNRVFELAQNLVWSRDRHLLKFGGGLLARRSKPILTAGRDGLYQFLDIVDFGLDSPSVVAAPVDRQRLPTLQLPDFQRRYRQNQLFFFAQDTFRVSPRLTLNFGARYESFGAPRNTGGTADGVLQVEGAAARIVVPDAPDVYRADRNDAGARLGFSWDPRGSARTVVRGAYGIFYDRPFDNLWQNTRSNRFVQASLPLPGTRFNYLDSLENVLTGLQGEPFAGDFPDITAIDFDLRTAYAQSYLLGIQHRLTQSWSLEAMALGSQGRKLITTDVHNRLGSRSGLGNASRLYQGANPAVDKIFNVNYRGNQGSSSYHGLAITTRYRGARSQFHLSYTWSHAIDNQSEALAGDFFDLSYTRIASGGLGRQSAFSRQFDSSGDRGSADFDQRHNLVFYSIWYVPETMRGTKAHWIVRDWRISQLAAFRSGFPYSAIAASTFASGLPLVVNNRADLASVSAETNRPAEGGRRLLNRDAFRQPGPGQIGNTGRNAFEGPGQFNLDVSLARHIPVAGLGESGRLTFRADVYNLLNHTNLAPPDAVLSSSTFGIAQYGRRGRDTGFPAQAPFEETGRQFQLILRVEF